MVTTEMVWVVTHGTFSKDMAKACGDDGCSYMSNCSCSAVV